MIRVSSGELVASARLIAVVAGASLAVYGGTRERWSGIVRRVSCFHRG